MGDEIPTTDQATDTTAPEWEVPAEWQEALADVPGLLAPTVKAQLEKTYKQHQAELAAASGPAIGEEWAKLVEEATGSGLSAEDLSSAWNYTKQLQESFATDPFGTLETLERSITSAVESGDITPREGAKLKREARQAAEEETADLRTDEQKQIEELQQRLDQREQQETERQQEQQEAAEAEQLADRYEAHLDKIRDDNPWLAQASPATLTLLTDTSLGYLEAGAADSPEQALDTAFARLKEALGDKVPTVAPAPRVPVGGGTAATPGSQAAPVPTTDSARKAAMLQAIEDLRD